MSPGFYFRSFFSAAVLVVALHVFHVTRADAAPQPALVTLHRFAGIDNLHQANSLIRGSDGFLYGDTCGEKYSSDGNTTDIVFKLRPDGSGYQILHTFPVAPIASNNYSRINTDGASPNGLTIGRDGFLYGTTSQGGQNGAGTVFKVDVQGQSFQVLHTFSALDANGSNSDGADCESALTLGPDGALYGTANGGGDRNIGLVFGINGDGTGFRILHAFPYSPSPFVLMPDGGQPNTSLVLADDGFFYGTTQSGGSSDDGVIFKVSADGQTFVKLHDASVRDGTQLSGLVQDRDGAFYGTGGGGANGSGTFFQMTPDGQYTVLYNFTERDYNDQSGSGYPIGVTMYPGSGVLYGCVKGGGTGAGAIFEIGKDGTGYQLLANFTDARPIGTLLLAEGTLYGLSQTSAASAAPAATQARPLASPAAAQARPLASPAADASHTGIVFGLALPAATTHILWSSASGAASLWNIDGNGTITSFQYGPYTDGLSGPIWTATALVTGADGTSYLLWNNPDGRAVLWNVHPDGTFAITGVYGPYTDSAPNTPWTATALAVGSGRHVNLLWTNADHRAALWNVDTTSASISGNFAITGVYGPYTDGAPNTPWTATALSVGPDKTLHLLWTNTNHRVVLWNVDTASTSVYSNFGLSGVYGPYTDGSNAANAPWLGTTLATDYEGVSHILWNNSNSKAILWNVDTGDPNISGNFGISGVYGPNTGMTAVGLSVGL